METILEEFDRWLEELAKKNGTTKRKVIPEIRFMEGKNVWKEVEEKIDKK